MSAKIKILIVADDTLLALMMVHVLSRAGCEVLAVRTEEKGLALALGNKFDLIALDVDTGGFEICSELKQRHFSRRTPIVFIARRVCDEDRQRGFELGAVDYITRPLDAPDFVRRILAHAKAKNNSGESIQSAKT
jgi:cyclic di-GMP phosphodiesterase